jgi:2-keto-4-pentenoate hydratase
LTSRRGEVQKPDIANLEGIAVDAKEIAALADRIVEGRVSKTTMDWLADATATLSEADAYKVQFAVHDKLEAAGWKLAGWKVAFAVPAQYEPLKLSGPAFAGLYTAASARAARCSRRAGR